jgi:formylglycine-generating enzyme required for sulfatase activity
LGDWLLVKRLTNGPLGQACVAEHRFTKKKAVLKILPEELASDRNFLVRFEEEISRIASLEHPSIVKTLSASSAEGVYFVATECVVDAHQETRTLVQHFSGRRASQAEVLKVAQQVAAALDYTHGLGLVVTSGVAHGNLKPNNILVADVDLVGPVIKVADFGLSRIIGIGSMLVRSFKAMIERMGLTESLFANKVGHDKYPVASIEGKQYEEITGALIQNLQFLSPEQRRGDWSDPCSADIWAFGVLVYWMLGGSYPEGAWEIEDSSKWSCDWNAIIRPCLSLDPAKRPAKLMPLLETKEGSSQKKTVIYTPKSTTPETPERQVKEYSPEKQDPRGIVPILTEMVRIPEGIYSRGSNQGCRDEIPRHAVRVASFSIDAHPVTNEQFVRFLDFLGDEKDCQNHDIIRLKDSRIKRSSGKFSIERGYGKHPVVGVTWYGAVAYAAWVGKRLPTEAEWEVACYGGLEHPAYPTGEDIEKTQANFFSSDTTPVKSYPPNGYDIYDMAGNVYEWCSDWYEYNYYEHSVQEPDFPKGPIQGVYRVLRGGCWKSLKEDLRCAKRHRNNPGAANGTYGFRCAQDYVPENG